MNILIVDDPSIQDAIAEKFPGCQVTVLKTYHEAVEKISAERFDALLTPMRLRAFVGTTPNGFLLAFHAIAHGIKHIALIDTFEDRDQLSVDLEFLLESNPAHGWGFNLNGTHLALRRIPRDKHCKVDWRQAFDLLSE